MEPSSVKPWYTKLRYIVPLGALVLIIGAAALGGNSATNSAQVTQTANVLNAAQSATIASTTSAPVQLQEATTTSTNTQAATQAQPAVNTASVQQQTQAQAPASSDLSNDNHYSNISGESVHSPAYSNDNAIPAGASAQCGDGTYSFSQHRSGTCSHHGGVATWY